MKQKDRHRTAVTIKAAEGETVVAVIRAIRRVHASSIKVEVVSARRSHAVISRTRATRRPPVAVDASVPRLTIVRIEVPAAHVTPHSFIK